MLARSYFAGGKLNCQVSNWIAFITVYIQSNVILLTASDNSVTHAVTIAMDDKSVMLHAAFV